MDNETMKLSNTLKELACLKTQLSEKRKMSQTVQEIVSDKNATDTWCKNIDYDNLDYEPAKYRNLQHLDYEPFETEKLKSAKNKLSKKAQEMQELSKNEPKKKPIFTHKVALLDLLNGVFTLFFIGTLIAAIITANIGAYIGAILVLTVVVLYTIFYKKGIEQIKKHRAVKKQNAENEEWNTTVYIKLCKEYDDKQQCLQDEYDRIMTKEISVAVEECIALAKQRQKALTDEVDNLVKILADEKFSIFSIREYSIEKLETLAEYLCTGRASDYKEAINLYSQEQAEQARHKDMLKMEERRAEEERIHNAQMERAARDTARHAEEAAKAAKRQEELKRQELLSKCKTCKKACYGNIDHCRGYERK